jgi:adenylate cyclase class IV
LDQVEGLGAFIEVEEITAQDTVEEIQNKLFEFVQTLGVLPEDRVTQGYDTMVYIKNKNL